MGSGQVGSRCGGVQALMLRKGLLVDLHDRATVQESHCAPVIAIADLPVHAFGKGVVCDGGRLAASGVGSTRVSECYCSPGAFAEVANTSSGPYILALAPAVLPEHLAGECKQVLDARDNGCAVPAFDSVADELEGFRHSLGPHSLDLGLCQLRYCAVSVWELHWSCAVIHDRGIRGGSAKKVVGRALHARIRGGCVAGVQRAHVWGECVDAFAWGGDGICDGGGERVCGDAG